MEPMDLFQHHANLERWRKQLAHMTDEEQRGVLVELLDVEEAEDSKTG